MDIVFNCPQCKQEIAVEESAAGVEIECPSCGEVQLIPQATPPANPAGAPPAHAPAAPEAESAPAPTPAPEPRKEHKPLAVPQREGPGEVLVKKRHEPADDDAKGLPRLRIHTIKRSSCVEVGHDRFDHVVSDFLEKVGKEHLISVHPVSYGTVDTMGNIVPDYGVMIIYTG